MTARRNLRSDEGASLIIALVIITVVAAVSAAVLGHADTSVRATVALRDQSGSAYDADGAAKVAVNALRRGDGFSGTAFNNATNTSCFGPTATQGTLNLRDFYPATGGQTGSAASSASVICTPQDGTGAQGSLVEITDANKPGAAVLTLGQNPGEDGINVKALAKDSGNVLVPFNVHGSIVSDSNINVSSGSLISSASVRAHTGCTGTITSTPPPDCSSSVVVDPSYLTVPQVAAGGGTPAVPIYRTVPANTSANCPGKLMTFSPGYYDDAAALSALMDGNGACKGSVWWFKPGTYYFDFHNTENPIASLSKAGGDIWLIKDGHLVAGRPCANRVFPDPVGDPNNPKCTEIATPTVPVVVPGACEFPTETQDTTAGVQFIFGGDSQMQLAGNGDAEICGSYATGTVSPAFYGLKSGSATTTSQAGLTLTTVPDQGNFNPATPAKLASADGNVVSWKSNKTNDSGTITVGGFAPTSPIPGGSTFRSATLKITHRHSDLAAKDTLAAVLTPTGGSAEPSASVVGSLGSSTLVTDSIPIDTSRTGSIAEAVHAGTFTGANVVLTASLTNKNDTEDIDTVTLDISYDPPAFRGETTSSIPGNCLTLVYTGVSGGPCAVLSTSTSYSGAFYMQGTTYTPIAPVDITLSNVTQQVLRFGLISRTLFIKETGSLAYSGPVIFLPDNSTGFGVAATIVYLSVYVCPGVSTSNCATDGSKKLQLTARVLIYDAPSSTGPGDRQMKILSWSQQR